MCDELGDMEYMKAYVEEASNPCTILSQSSCSAREAKYIKKWSSKLEKVDSQIQRLTSMQEKKMKPELKEWVETRLKILKQFDVGKAEL